jgi:hypothetical protein
MEPRDPSFLLAMAASVDAIFLSSFVSISQNRMAENDARRADLNLQISVLSEHEVTRLITVVSAITDHFGLSEAIGPELQELKKDVDPNTILDEIESSKQERELHSRRARRLFVTLLSTSAGTDELQVVGRAVSVSISRTQETHMNGRCAHPGPHRRRDADLRAWPG